MLHLARILIAEGDGRSMLPAEHKQAFDLYCNTTKGNSSVRGAGLTEAAAWLSDLALSLAKVSGDPGTSSDPSSSSSAQTGLVYRSLVVFGRALLEADGAAGFFSFALPHGFEGRTMAALDAFYDAINDGGVLSVWDRNRVMLLASHHMTLSYTSACVGCPGG